MVKIAYGSDLHTEFSDVVELPQVDSDTDIVIIAGDMSTATGKKWAAIFNHVRDGNDNIIGLMTMGNHDYYHGGLLTTLDTVRERLAEHTNLHVLENDVYVYAPEDGKAPVEIVGATLWSSLDLKGQLLDPVTCSLSIADFSVIHDFSPALMKYLNAESDAFIKQAVKEARLRFNTPIVVTHFMPSYEATKRGQFFGDPLNPYFCHELEYGEYRPDHHIFGHTHDRMEFIHNNTAYHCNPRGYPRENAEPFTWSYIHL